MALATNTKCVAKRQFVNPLLMTFFLSPQERMTNRLGKIQSSSEQYLLQHRFGDQLEDDEVEDEELVKGRCLYDVHVRKGI